MGISHSSNVVPYVVHCFWEAQSFIALPEGVRDLCIEEDRETTFYEHDIAQGDTRGWEHQGAVHVGRRERIYAGEVTKGDYTVFLVNESPYESVDCYLMAIVGERREDVAAFLRDWDDTRTHKNLVPTILDTDSVDRYL